MPKKMLKNYEIEVEFFDLETFEYKIMMNVFYIIENWSKICFKLNKEEKELNNKLENKSKDAYPKTEL